ncbi:twin-arginine translocation signal domain-containing protein [Actinomadura madurae]|uniref:twin-arginine translocation signal domain-containing protein n=1 Tax=Actinomadura madurae TaxID=1993 RepID=UPI0020D256A0|nr:twin-arginine translocation signal domain-containing protein [Actinomadura madurae]MCP9947960.1 twin-arginine translocation signal domain-containing protein [Actinomadura madurae]MCP9977206.1 twin-arginine translocation signal domain-containing protein [Actinomadura madurae]
MSAEDEDRATGGPSRRRVLASAAAAGAAAAVTGLGRPVPPRRRDAARGRDGSTPITTRSRPRSGSGPSSTACCRPKAGRTGAGGT